MIIDIWSWCLVKCKICFSLCPVYNYNQMDIIGNRQESKQISTNYSVERIALIDRQPILWWRWFADQLKTLHSFYKTKPTTSTGPPSHLWGLLGADKTQWRGSFQLIAANIGTNCDTVSDTHTHRGRLATISIPRTRKKGQVISDFFSMYHVFLSVESSLRVNGMGP